MMMMKNHYEKWFVMSSIIMPDSALLPPSAIKNRRDDNRTREDEPIGRKWSTCMLCSGNRKLYLNNKISIFCVCVVRKNYSSSYYYFNFLKHEPKKKSLSFLCSYSCAVFQSFPLHNAIYHRHTYVYMFVHTIIKRAFILLYGLAFT